MAKTLTFFYINFTIIGSLGSAVASKICINTLSGIVKSSKTIICIQEYAEILQKKSGFNAKNPLKLAKKHFFWQNFTY